MKLSAVLCGPDVAYGPLALLAGSFEEKLQKARQYGYDGFELMVRDPRRLDVAGIKRAIANQDLQVSQVVTGELFGADRLCLVTPDAVIWCRAQERIKAVIDLAAEIGGFVNIGRFRGRLDWMDSPEGGYAVAVERIGLVADWANEKGVQITLEPINRYEIDFILTTQDGLGFLRDLDRPNVGLMLDMFHMNIEDASIAGSLSEAYAAGCLWHVHIADSNRRYPGSGHLDFVSIVNTLKQLGYSAYLSAELFPLPDADTAAKKTAEYFRALL